MKYTNSKQFVKSKLSEESSLITFSSDLERDDDDPLSIGTLSVTFLGIMIAFFTFFLPSISVLLSRPFSQDKEMTTKQFIQKNGP